MTNANKNPQPDRGKPTVAAAIFALAAILSASVMVWSGWQLYHGESFAPAVKATGQRCDWVVLLDAPAELGPALDALQTHAAAALPAEVTRLLAAATPFAQNTRAPGLAVDEPWTLCGWDRDAVLTLPNRPQTPDAAHTAQTWSQQLAALAGDATATRLDVTPELLRLAFAPASHDPERLLARALPDQPASHLGVALPYRAALERVGGGTAHLFVARAAAVRLLRGLTREAWLDEGIANVQWLGVGLRRDADRVRLHVHAGIDQHGAIWLKEIADVAAVDDATGWIAADATAAAIVRLPAALRAKLAGQYGPTSPLLAQSLAALNAAPTLVWQRAPDGAESAVWTADVPPPAGLPTALVHGWRVVATTPAMLVQTQAVLGGKLPGQAAVADHDRQRLLTSTQGWFDGPMQVDWVWSDLGVAFEAAWRLASR